MLKKMNVILFLFMLFFLFSCNNNKPKEESLSVKSTKKTIKVDKKLPKQQRIQEAITQEFEKTKDIKSNIVPKERLWEALEYTKELRNNSNSKAPIADFNWKERGPNNVGGRTRALIVDLSDPSGNTVFAGGVGGGIWKTTTASSSSPNWTVINDEFDNLAISALAQDPSTPSIMYFGTGEGWFNADAMRGQGIWKSTDSGTTWNQLVSTNSNAAYQYIKKLMVNTNGDIYVATRSAGLLRSTDGGTSFVQVATFAANVTDIEFTPNGEIYAAFQGTGVYKSSTGNTGSWVALNGLPGAFGRVELATAASDNNRLYIVFENSSDCSAIYRSTNGGSSFTSLTCPAAFGMTNYTRSQAWYDLIATVDPNNADRLFIGGIDLLVSADAGNNWTQISQWFGGNGLQYVHADQHNIVFQNGSSDVIYFTNDGGVFRTNNGSAAIPTIDTKVSDYNVTQFYACAIHPTADTDYFLAGAQDNGSHIFDDPNIDATFEVTGGDGAFCHIDQNNPNIQITSYVYDDYYITNDNWATNTNLNGTNSGDFINPTDYDSDSKVLYGAHNGGSYERITGIGTTNTRNTNTIGNFGGGTITHISVSDNTANRVFFGLNNGEVVRVDNANGGSPTSTVVRNGNGSVSCIAIEEGNDNHLLVTYSNYGQVSVYETTNGGTNWTAVEGNLPDMPVRWAIFNPNNSDEAAIATELGVWSTDNINGGSTQWSPSNTGLANTRVDMLQYRTSDNIVIAATHGRGLFSSDVFAVPSAKFSSNKIITYVGKDIEFYDNSTRATSWSWNFGDASTSTIENPTKSYTTPALYTVNLTINSGVDSEIKTNYIHVLPNRGTEYLVGDGGNFETNSLDFGVDNDGGTPFESGNSAIAGKNGTNSGSTAWVTGLSDANYVDNTTSYLYTPNYNFTNAGAYTLRFEAKYDIENQWDGFRLEYSLDKGDNWTHLGNSVAADWYNYNNPNANRPFPQGEAYFTGLESNYTLKSLDVSGFSGQPTVAFRFVFKSDVSETDIGLAIDDFEILGETNTALPLNLLSFDATLNNDKEVNLYWSTVNEENVDKFEIEHSIDGIQFKGIGTVNANNLTTVNEYSFTHIAPESGVNYYRLKELDFDNQFAYSEIESIQLSSNQLNFTVNPNPIIDNILNFRFDFEQRESLNIDVISMSGQSIYRNNLTPYGKTLSVDLNETGIAKGNYLVRFSDNKRFLTKKVVVQ